MIEIKNLSVTYGKTRVYDNFNLNLEEGKITCILGESGCGKTTLLNAVAGLVTYGGDISPVSVSYVFQSPRLIPYVNILKNLTVTGSTEESAVGMLEKVGLKDKRFAFPSQLSGGEAQRVSLCRAFLKKSDILLMDEPFSSLDYKTKLSVMNLFKTLQSEEGKTTLFVTHDIDEAIYLADRIVVLGKGEAVVDFIAGEKTCFGANSSIREKILNILVQ